MSAKNPYNSSANLPQLTSIYITREKYSPYSTSFGYLPDPDKILKNNNYDYTILRDVMNDPHVMAAVQQRKMQVLQMGWELEYDFSPKIKNEVAQFLDELEIQRIISSLLDSLFFGFSVSEIYWKIINKKFVPVDLIDKPQDYFLFDNDNKLKLRPFASGIYHFGSGIDLPDYKFILSQNKPTFDNPYGEKLLSRCYWNVSFKRSVIEYWQLLTERYGVPFLVGRYPAAASEEEKNSMLDQLYSMIENNIALLKEGNQVEFLSNSKNDVGGLFDHLINFHNREISKAILSVTATVEVQQYGNYKTSQVHKEMLEYLGIADKKIVEKALNQLIEFYVQLNYGDIPQPHLRLLKKESIIEESSDRDIKLTQMGVRFTKDYYLKRYNLSDGDFSLV
ncbi:MAG: DUF935 domain-containing protein [Melioribacteraceae bacterium]|nr:DUF935 domain-containing protein [Melioribacteraceae bacterium]